jgi:uncharacterized protein (TIGR03067 family)
MGVLDVSGVTPPEERTMKTASRAVLTTTILLFAITALRAAPVPRGSKDVRQAKEVERFQGDWVLVEMTASNGVVSKHKEGQPDTNHFNLYIQKDRAIFHFDGTDPDDEIVTTFTVNPSKSPKEIDFTGVSSSITGYKKGTKDLGAYKLEGDTLILRCFGGSQTSRPTGFTPDPEKDICTYKLVRSKKPISDSSTRVGERPK